MAGLGLMQFGNLNAGDNIAVGRQLLQGLDSGGGRNGGVVGNSVRFGPLGLWGIRVSAPRRLAANRGHKSG